MTLLDSPTRAILWAQWRTLANFYPRSSKLGVAFTLLGVFSWYGLWASLSVVTAFVLSRPASVVLLQKFGWLGLLLLFVYWQLIPIFLVSNGISLDLKRMMVYPVPHARLFRLEVLLRISTALEMVVLFAGMAAGLLLNPKLSWTAPLALLPFAVFNLALSAGVRDLLTRLLARRKIREVLAFVFVLLAALPQLLILLGVPGPLRQVLEVMPRLWTPWTSAAAIASGLPSVFDWLILFAWTLAAWAFGRWQFERSLRFDAAAVSSTAPPPGRRSFLERFYTAPRALFADPLAALIEKELRFLTRAPRFRLLFLMGFSFGLVIWLPMMMGGGRVQPIRAGSPLSGNYLTVVSVYALLLLGEVLIWNHFGFDRAAAQFYFVVPPPLRQVLLAKNCAALVFILIEITAVALVCALFRMPLAPEKVVESYVVTLVFSAYLLAAGNIASARLPRGVDPTQSWRSSSTSRVQPLLLLIYPLLAGPVLIAYAVRYAFDAAWLFYPLLGAAALLGVVLYRMSLDVAVSTALGRREEMLEALGRSSSPMT